MGATPAMITLGRARSYAHTIIQCLSVTARRCRCRGRRTSVFFKILGIHFLAISAFSLALGPPMVLAFDSLMPGATPANFSVPAGWLTYRMQTFEGGLGAGEDINNGNAITTERSHSGAKSLGTTIDGATALAWYLTPGPGRDGYVSFWEYTEDAMRYNDEYWFWQIRSPGPVFQEIIIDWIGSGSFNNTNSNLSIISQGQVDAGNAPVPNGAFIPVPKGAWHQWEVWHHTDTTNTSFVKIYVDGVFRWSKGPTNLNGTVDMQGGRLTLAGTYTKLLWRRADGSCGAFMGDGTTPPPTNCFTFANCPCGTSMTTPLAKRFIDDIIVLVPGSGSGGVHDIPPGPPAPPIGLFVR